MIDMTIYPSQRQMMEMTGKLTVELHRCNAILRSLIAVLVNSGRMKKVREIEQQIEENNKVIKSCFGDH